MNCELIPRDTSRYILEVKEKEEAGRCYIQWDSGIATHYLIVMRPVGADDAYFFSPSFEQDIRRAASGLSADECFINDNTRAVLITFAQFMKAKRWYYNPRPMRATVFSCDLQGDTLRVFMPENVKGCSVAIPERLYIHKEKAPQPPQKRGLFHRGGAAAPAEDVFLVSISRINEYRTGIFYTVSGVDIRYPISQGMLGQSFKITVPYGADISFVLNQDIRDNYKVIIS